MDELNWLGLMIAFSLGMLVSLFLLGLTIMSQLSEIIRHLQAQGPVQLQQARWLQIMTSHAWMQRSYLQRLCVGAGLEWKEGDNGAEAKIECSDARAPDSYPQNTNEPEQVLTLNL